MLRFMKQLERSGIPWPVLIHAGAGGVGSIAIQLAKHLGASVATTVSGSNAAWVRELGADVSIDYRTEEFATIVHDYDLALDSLGGDNLESSLGVLPRGGKASVSPDHPTPRSRKRSTRA